MHISILLPEGNISVSNLEATYKMFTMANDALTQSDNVPKFVVQLVAVNREKKSSNNIFDIKADITIQNLKKTDLIIIPAVHGPYENVVDSNKNLVPWLVDQYRKGAEIASLCIGAFILASSGLLDGRGCTTHWMAAEEFKSMFPLVNLQDDKIITDENGIYTSGGAYSSLNLNLYLIEKFIGREMAVRQSKIFEIDIDRHSQSPFIIFNTQKNHDDELMQKVQLYIEHNYSENITVSELCAKFSIGRRTFERRFSKAINNTVIEYLQRVRVEAAKKMFEKNYLNISEVMYSVGYTDATAFRKVFLKIVGLTPSAYQKRYARIN
ncbi:transcriptional regulator GlxA family with amidase domain [Algoriphagus sp. 4150]|uniref:GlxA family transcriptional regulator n=1 Tax=Algoriphagus sp. 4150 TaxID=2817756 RepID=UPI002863B014|nr:helix-turn-helix domain-containing protein [Algoriphagus sp. 4150]MDR7130585.1 transcriptional regulator GlxA family with amidase domain [Algoriphagus sp. 4150]